MITALITNIYFVSVWLVLMIVSEIVFLYDIRKSNSHLAPLMKWVWFLTVLYSGILGLTVYYYSGRKEIEKDDLWRKSFRSVSHCYSGCGGGEIVGVFIAAGIFSLGNIWVAVISFTLAYIAGYALTVGPLVQEGMVLGQALKDAFYTETASITVMELVAIGSDLWLAGGAHIGEMFFWSSLILSLTLGYIVAYPVNVYLIKKGIKEHMHNPKEVS